MVNEDRSEILSPLEVARSLMEDTGQQIGELAVALLYIVRALKKQPGFDVASFNAEMLRGAE